MEDRATDDQVRMRQFERAKIEKLKQKLLVLLERDKERRRQAEMAAASDANRMYKEHSDYWSLIGDAYVLKEYINYARAEMDHEEVVKLETDLKALVKKIKQKQAQLFYTNYSY